MKRTKKILTGFILLSMSLFFASCATILNSLLGNTCDYPNCNNMVDLNCGQNYCNIHCVETPDYKKIDQSIKKQVDPYRKEVGDIK